MPAPPAPSIVRPLIGGVAALAVAMGVGRFAYTPILPAMQQDVGFGSDVAGLLASLNHLGYFLGAFAAAIPGAGSRRLALRFCLLTSLGTTAAMAYGDSVVLWAVLRFVSGLASAGIFVLAVSTLLETITQHGRPGLSGYLFSGVGLGIIVSGLVVLLLGDAFVWRFDWLGLGLVSALLVLPAWLWVGDRGPEDTGPAPGPQPAPRRFPLPALYLAYFCEGGGYIVSGTFLVAIVQGLPGLAGLSELAWVVVGLAAAPSCLLWAWAAQRLGTVGALITAHLVQAFGILLPLMSGGALAVIGGAMLFGGTFMGITTLAVSFAGAIAPARRARAVGFATASFGLGQIIGPFVAGAMAERSGNFDEALMMAAAVVAVGAVLLALGAAWTRSRAAAPVPDPEG